MRLVEPLPESAPKRLMFTFNRGSFNLPRLRVLIEDYREADGVEHERTLVMLGYGNGYSDPVFSIDLELEGTWLGRLIRRVSDWRARRRQ